MPKRWGSYIKGERIILNPLLIQGPKEAIDYVITHELCHMKYKNHDSKFYGLLETKFPNWQKTKVKLELLI
jgi:predicted metal-dependent hydrolase